MLNRPKGVISIRKHLSMASSGIMSAMTADLAFIMVYGLLLRAITDHEVYGPSTYSFNSVLILAPIGAGIPAGLIYGLYRQKLGQGKSSILYFWLSFWAVTLLSLLLTYLMYHGSAPGNIFAAAFGLLPFTGIWTYLMEIICDNPLSFAHLMPEELDCDRIETEEISNSHALIKRRRD